MSEWLAFDPLDAAMIALSAVCAYAAVILYCRVAGLRSFATMSAFDFVMTVAVGTIFGSTIATKDPSLLAGLFVLALLFILQKVVAVLRQRTRFDAVTDNTPVLLMRDGEILHENLRRAQVTERDLVARLRRANVRSFDTVNAVVLETTGDVSVLHGHDRDGVHDSMLAGVRR